MPSARCLIPLAIVLLTFTGCERNRPLPSSPPAAPASAAQSRLHEDIDATLWMRTSAEYQVLLHDTWRRALAAVDTGLADPAWEALSPPDSPPTADRSPAVIRPPAVILDIDETALDNMEYLLEMIHDEPHEFALERWNAWCLRASAPALPGAAEFVTQCRARGVAIRFITNRGTEVRAATLVNLQSAGLSPPGGGSAEEILCKGDRPEWGSDKTSRRALVASQFRVLAVIGDDLGDFVWSGLNATPDQRRVAAMKTADRWGRQWFLLPNPNYGGWERAIEGYDAAPRPERLHRRLKALAPPGT